MKCWNCGREIPETAKACQYCEASTETGTGFHERCAATQEAFGQLPPDAQETLRELAKTRPPAEGFSDSCLVGDCPGCGSSNTGDHEHDPEVEDNCVGRCFECGFVWCLECDRELDKRNPHCSCFEEDEGQ